MRTFKNIAFALSYMLRFSPLYFFSGILLAIFGRVQVFLEFTFAGMYILEIIEYGRPFQNALVFMLLLFGFALFNNLFSAVHYCVIVPIQQEKLYKNVNTELYRKAASLDLACYDDPDFYNDFVWSISEANKRIEAVFQKIVGLSQSLTVILLSGTLFIFVDRIGLLFVAFSLISGIIISKISNKLSFKRETELLPIRRKRDYLSRVFYLADYAKEIRLFGVAKRLKKDFNDVNREVESVLGTYNGRIAAMGFINHYVFSRFVFSVLYLTYLMFLKIVKNTLSYGSMIALFNASYRLSGDIQSLSNMIPAFHADSLYIDRIRKFLGHEAAVNSAGNAAPPPPNPSTIEFKNVSFSYADNGPQVLKNISLTIKPGERVAIVGYNGAGKTTLVKLLMRLYDPTEGEILLDGVNIKEYDLAEYRRRIGTTFQDYQIFAASVYDNVVMDTVEGLTQGVEAALARSGFGGLDIGTPLTREFDDAGTNLSGGETQKVAIGRAFFKSADYMIFDEPSSALDPISEYHVYNTMMEASAGKTVVFISHRLASTKMADIIYMFEKGQLIEAADHETLMGLDGKYAEMFNMQAEKYRSAYLSS